MPRSRNAKWANRNEEERLRCKATERRGQHLRQCTEDRRTEHVHQWNGTPFSEGYSMPVPGGPTLAPNQIKPH
jgi:hypothetical protein